MSSNDDESYPVDSISHSARMLGSIAPYIAGCLTIFMRIFFLIALVFLISETIVPLVNIIRAKSWEKTECEITRNAIRKVKNSKSMHYIEDIAFKYKYKDKEYTSSRLDFLELTTRRDNVEETLRKYPRGKITVCYVNPGNPESAVINREFRWDRKFSYFSNVIIYVCFIFMMLLSLGLHYITAPNYTAFDFKSRIVIRSNPKVEKQAEIPEWAKQRKGETVLKSQSNPYLNAIGGTIAMIVVVSFSYIVLLGSDEQFLEEDRMLLNITAAIIIPLNLYLLVRLAQSYIVFLNPKLSLCLEHDMLRLGEKVKLKWAVGRMGIHRIKGLSIKLVCIECGRNDKGHMKRDKLLEEELVDTQDPSSMQEGSAEIHIPEEMMHSFGDICGGVVWQIETLMEVSNSLDTRAEYKLTVVPNVPDVSA
ncbi:MAG: DUF3592 domain-containing protein [Deltaproteobacteria bacterium]|nr:DUF3592 domain-containing protein [Deltaproteobacteria bacterium]